MWHVAVMEPDPQLLDVFAKLWQSLEQREEDGSLAGPRWAVTRRLAESGSEEQGLLHQATPPPLVLLNNVS